MTHAAKRLKRAPRRLGLAAVAAVSLLVAGLWAARAARSGYIRWRVDRLAPLIDKHATACGVDPALVFAVVAAESGGDPRAKSGADARGLMQVTEITLAEVRDRRHAVGPGDLYDPDYGLQVGCLYLASLLERFHGDVAVSMAAYHMGPSAVAKWQSANPGAGAKKLLASPAVGPKTRAYVAGVMAGWAARRADAGSRAKP